jgi:uridine kinase
MPPILIGICGGTGAGKTTLTKRIIEQFGEQRVSLIDTDSYYLDRSNVPLGKRHHFNFDHPDALDIPLLVSHLQSLKSGHAIEKQVYDFTTHTRKHDTVKVEARDIIVVDGILIFAINEVCELFDIKIFIDEEADVRLLRRLQRDVTERGRTIESVARQYLETVRPMHIKYVEPSKSKADIVLRHGDSEQIVINAIQKMLRETSSH